MSYIETRLLNSLAKVFLDSAPVENLKEAKILANDTLSFQVAFRGDEFEVNKYNIKLSVQSDIDVGISKYVVENVPCDRTSYSKIDRFYDRLTPGLYPDALLAYDTYSKAFATGRWYSVWISINESKKMLQKGRHYIEVKISDSEGKAESVQRLELEVLEACLPPQKLIYTNWFHCDCICDAYGCKMFSKKHWELIESFMSCATMHGQNMILVPAFTPPLDTPIGAERKTAQLVGVKKDNGKYTFDFTGFIKFIELAKRCGFEYFEHSHLFTQWGATHAPKIIATVDGKKKRIFGWETDACSDEYRGFLKLYLKAVKKVVEELGITDNFYYHISDEPHREDLEAYRGAREGIIGEVRSDHIIDAISDIFFVEHKLAENPIPAVNEVEPFVGKVNMPWTYYTGLLPAGGYSNRLISMPASRNRILGIQLYYYGIKGFLHWGYNFYYNSTSQIYCNPFVTTDANREFVSGTSYMVYPHKNGAAPSIRQKNFGEGICDYRALEALEAHIGREGCMAFIEESFNDFNFKTCMEPEDTQTLFEFRQRLNQKINSYKEKL